MSEQSERAVNELSGFHRRDAEDAKKTEIVFWGNEFLCALCVLSEHCERAVGKMGDMSMENLISSKIILAAIEVHRTLGPGLLESAYERCLCHELALQDISFEKQVPLPVTYKGVNLDCGYRLDLVVEGKVILELKSVARFEAIHDAQLLTYLRLTRLKLGLLLNFNVDLMKNGIKRIVNGL